MIGTSKLFAWLLTAAMVVGFGAPAGAQDKAELAVINAKVLTMDGNQRTAQAVAIREGRFVAVGTNSDIKSWIGPQSKIIDAQGKTVIPGLIESHSHAIGAARNESSDPYEEMTSIAVIQEWVRRAARKKPEGEWIVIPRSYPTRLRERRFPTRAELDAAASRHPVVFDAAYSHVLNTLALEKAGIRRDTPPLPVGEIVRDAAGQPTGLLRNARGLLSRFLPSPNVSQSDALKHLERIHQIYLSLGITSIVERGASLDDYRVYQEMRAQERLVPRSRITLRLPGTTASDAEKFIKALPMRPGEGDDRLSAGPLKITVDGGILIGTAYMRKAYGARAMSLFNLTDPEYRGSLSLKPESITALITTGHRLGWQMSAHVTGDAGVDLVLDAVESAGKVKPVHAARFNLIHAYFPNAAAAARAKKLGVCVDTQAAWFYKDADALQEALGPDRIKNFIGVRDWLKAGVPVIANTDHMLGTDPNRALNPFNPFLTMYVLVTRKTQSGTVIGSDQKVTRLEALQMLTRAAAYMTFDESKKGSIEVGKLGDLAILLDDYTSIPEERIKDLRVDATIIGGRVVYQR